MAAGKLIGYARVSTRRQDADRQVDDLVAAGVRRDDLYVDHGVSGARASRPKFDKAVAALEAGDTLVITTWTGWAGQPRTCFPSPRPSGTGEPGCGC